jgi:hypothetical protein
MAKDVHHELLRIVMKMTGKNEEEAEKYLKQLEKEGRYLTGLKIDSFERLRVNFSLDVWF